MALLRELGNKYPIVTEGIEFNVEDEEITMGSGDIVETLFESDEDIKYYKVASAIEEILRIKEEYPGFVLHYLKFETRRVTVQYSIAPRESISGKPISGAIAIAHVVLIGLVIIAIIAAVVAAIVITLRAIRGYWWSPPLPTGNALAQAKHGTTEMPIANVKISTDEEEGTTGPNGEPILFDNLLAGPHVFVGETLEGFWPPLPVEQSVIKDAQIVITIWYYPDDEPPPTTGFLVVNTTPVRGEVFIEATSYGEAPVGPIELEQGIYNVSYGAIEGWETPPPDTATIIGGKTKSLIGYYKRPSENWWEKYIWYALIGGGVIIGAATLLPPAIRALMKRGKKE